MGSSFRIISIPGIFGQFANIVAERCVAFSLLVTAYTDMCDLRSAEYYKEKAISMFETSKSTWNQIHLTDIKAAILEMSGQYEAAELHRRQIMQLIPSIKNDSPSLYTSKNKELDMLV